MNKYHNATLLANDKILQHFATILETMYKNSVLESYLLINTKELQKTGTLHNQLIPLEDITLATLDVCSNLVENYPPSHLHHLVAILHFKEDLQLIDDAG